MAAESQLTEANTWPAQSYAANFFQKLPTDERFLQTTIQKIEPTTTIEGRNIEFKLPAFSANNIWLIQDTQVRVAIKILKADGNLPDKAKAPVLVNNILHSLFSDVKLYLNDQLITTSSSDYHYKAYISNLLTFPNECKSSFLQSQGYYTDTAFNYGNVTSNLGAVWRHRLFRKNFDKAQDYKTNPVILMGRLMHDLIHIRSGIAPDKIQTI